MDFGGLDWNSSMYYVYERNYDRANGGPTDKDIYEAGYVAPVVGGNYTDEEKEKVQESYEHAARKDNPHDVKISQIEGLSEALEGLQNDIDAAGIFDAANAVTSASNGAKIVKNEEGKNELVLDVNRNSAVEIGSDGKLTLEWENE